jgi:hypothetical protein
MLSFLNIYRYSISIFLLFLDQPIIFYNKFFINLTLRQRIISSVKVFENFFLNFLIRICRRYYINKMLSMWIPLRTQALLFWRSLSCSKLYPIGTFVICSTYERNDIFIISRY